VIRIDSKLAATALVMALLAIYALIILRNAWVGDDAYITFRAVDNFVNGFGLRWNIDERVQTYTHPLWLFAMTAVYVFTREAFYTSIFLSVAVSLAAVAVVAFKAARSTAAACLGIAVLALSKGFVDYSTSGLENPLSHLLIAVFFWLYYKTEDSETSPWLLSLVAALMALSRMDIILLTLPALGCVFWKNRSLCTVKGIALGFSPFILWEAFSFFYYGFLFPNTAYSKLNTGIPWHDLVGQGLYYLWNSIMVDPITLTVIAGAVIAAAISRRERHVMVGIGILLYLTYVIRIGGCFMTGRLLTAPLLCAVIALSQFRPTWRPKLLVPAAAAILILGLISGYSPVYTTSDYGGETERYTFARGIADERGWYFPSSSLLNIDPYGTMPNHRYVERGRRASGPVIATITLGYYGYFAPRQTHIVDAYGLADPLLSRLPVRTDVPWRIGHFERIEPEGYYETLLSGENQIADPKLAEYYSAIAFVTRGSLFDFRRILTAVKLNLGIYDDLIRSYW